MSRGESNVDKSSPTAQRESSPSEAGEYISWGTTPATVMLEKFRVKSL